MPADGELHCETRPLYFAAVCGGGGGGLHRLLSALGAGFPHHGGAGYLRYRELREVNAAQGCCDHHRHGIAVVTVIVDRQIVWHLLAAQEATAAVAIPWRPLIRRLQCKAYASFVVGQRPTGWPRTSVSHPYLWVRARILRRQSESRRHRIVETGARRAIVPPACATPWLRPGPRAQERKARAMEIDWKMPSARVDLCLWPRVHAPPAPPGTRRARLRV